MENFSYDVIVVGGGHAGCEAAHAAACMGAHTCLITMDMNKIAQMSCNPAVGGIAKGQIVREIDALGGGMGIVTDSTAIQFRMLNLSKGPAMWSPRAQCDREKFIWKWREILDSTDNLEIWQDQVEELIIETNSSNNIPSVSGVKTIWGNILKAPCVVITAGTFLNGIMHVGRKMIAGGRCAEPAALHLTENINALGIQSARMKTGTPVRIDKRSIHFEDTTEQPGEDVAGLFSFLHNTSGNQEQPYLEQLSCWLLNTTPECHEILQSGFADSPLYNGQIKSIGPRYCPSIETKLHTFPDKDHHPLFLEPEGTNTNEMYLNGFSSSLPMEIQLKALKKIPALRDIKIYRPGYAIEYDFFDPTQLYHSLMSKKCNGLFFAGQVNGTTGYEEAAAQGIMAGINATLYAGQNSSDKDFTSTSFTLSRDEAYIGVLIDDLVTKGVDEPYRMFTSRAEYRILLRQDNADTRLTEKAYKIGLATKERYDLWKTKQERVDHIISYCDNKKIKGKLISEIISRPEVELNELYPTLPHLCEYINKISEVEKMEVIKSAETYIKYAGYIEREKATAEKMHRLENIHIRNHFNYENIQSLSTEARQKLTSINPETLAQASRIPGVSPSDINVLLVLMKR